MKSNRYLPHSLTNLSMVILALSVVAYFAIQTHAQKKAPVVDTKKTDPKANITQEELDKLGLKRDLSKLINTKPASDAPAVLSNNAPGFTTNVNAPTGLHTVTFTTPTKDTVEVYLPNRLPRDSTFTASMKLKPADGQKGPLENYYLVIEDQAFRLVDGMFEVHLTGPDMKSARLGLVDKKGQPLAGVELLVDPKVQPPATSTMPNSATSGNLIKIDCPCQGPIGPEDYVKIGGQAMPILAAAPGSMVILNTYAPPGLTEIETKVGSVSSRKDFRNITLQLSADKLDLIKGESTTVHIVVSGLEKLKSPAVMTVEASGVVSMGGGNSQTINIDPSAVAADGTYRTAETLYANSAGTFGVTVTVTADEKK